MRNVNLVNAGHEELLAPLDLHVARATLWQPPTRLARMRLFPLIRMIK